MSTLPHVVVFFDAPGTDGTSGPLLLQLATAHWRYSRGTTLLVDAHPRGALTNAVDEMGRLGRPFRLSVGDEMTFDDVLDAAAKLEEEPPFRPWRLSQRARSLVPSGGDPLGAHAKALGAVVATGGALDLRERVDEVLRPSVENFALTLVSAPGASTGLGTLLGSLADVVALVAGNLDQLLGMLPHVERAAKAADLMGPDAILPILLPGGQAGRLPAGKLARLATVALPGIETPEHMLPLLRAILASK